MSYSWSYAPTNRAKCKGKCGEKIEKGAIRLATSSDGDYHIVSYRCLDCVTDTQFKNIVNKVGSVEDVEGFDGLTAKDQAAVRKKAGIKPAAKAAGKAAAVKAVRKAKAEPKPKGRAPKPKPKAAAPKRKALPPVAKQHEFLDKGKEYDLDGVKAMLEELPDLINVQPAGRWSVLHQFAENGDADAVRYLLEMGADREAKNKDGQTPAEVASGEAVEALEEAGEEEPEEEEEEEEEEEAEEEPAPVDKGKKRKAPEPSPKAKAKAAASGAITPSPAKKAASAQCGLPDESAGKAGKDMTASRKAMLEFAAKRKAPHMESPEQKRRRSGAYVCTACTEPNSQKEMDEAEQDLRKLREPMLKLMAQGEFAELAYLCYKSKALGPVGHDELLKVLMALPHTESMDSQSYGTLCNCIRVLASSVLWASKLDEEYFLHFLLPVVNTFLEESKEAVERRRSNKPLRNECYQDLVFGPGAHKGELKRLSMEPLPRSHESRAMDESDTVWLTLMDEDVPDKLCECRIVSMIPLVLWHEDEESDVFQLALSGCHCRIDKLASRTTFCRTLAALHCLVEPERPKEPKMHQRLPPNFTPEPLLPLLRPFGVSEAERREWAKEPVELLTRMPAPNRQLNKPQLAALDHAGSRRLTLIQGPPGTGKTTTCVQILRRWALGFKPPNKRTKILATSGSNIAVDNLVEGLVAEGIKVVRIGRPESARPELQQTVVENVAARRLKVSWSEVPVYQRRAEMQKAIQAADVVCCTAVSAGGGLLKDISFPLVLVDEASQATEPVTMVPICHGCKALVLCGDHCQLPPTVKSEGPHAAALSMSLFERLALSGVKPILLNVQYRMHPLLSAYPSIKFYGGKLQDALHPTVRPKGWMYKESLVVVPVFEPEGEELPGPEQAEPAEPAAGRGTSHSNRAEANEILAQAKEYISNGGSPKSLGIITPYDSQKHLIRSMLQENNIRTGLHGVEVNSVDGYQGREKEVIMISTVRSNKGGATGFVKDWRRINVALTRAKGGLLVVCNPATLARDRSSWLPWLWWSRWRGCWLHSQDIFLPQMHDRVAPPEPASPPKRARGRSPSPPPVWAKTPGSRPVDPELPNGDKFKVVGDWSVLLNQTNVNFNNNKYYRIQLLEDDGGQFYAFTRWGRVGAAGQHNLANCGSQANAENVFKAKFKDKSGVHYDNIDTHDWKPVVGKYTVVKTEDQDGGGGDSAPLGKLTEEQIEKGQAVLQKMDSALAKKGDKSLVDLSSEYYTLIPHDFGFKVPPVINTKEMLEAEEELLKFYLRMGFEQLDKEEDGLMPISGVMKLDLPKTLEAACSGVCAATSLKSSMTRGKQHADKQSGDPQKTLGKIGARLRAG
ncbi:unnamed protein product [Effrenium voratum]|uniref:Uncharacterized protein n=1 Tax=Effrenium voratum TaxID=2562239 RepID=A0AA36J9V9_9DINO|nr:unnamed protein product [Effrenium voratum]